jgi:hypothetical protein
MRTYIGPGNVVITSYADELMPLPLHGRPTWMATVIAAAAITVLLGVILGIVAYIAWAGTQAWDAVLAAVVLALWIMAKGARK